MSYPISSSLLDGIVLAVVERESTYGYDQAYAGRNRRYYQITEHGRAALRQHRIDWQNYRSGIDTIFFGGVNE